MYKNSIDGSNPNWNCESYIKVRSSKMRPISVLGLVALKVMRFHYTRAKRVRRFFFYISFLIKENGYKYHQMPTVGVKAALKIYKRVIYRSNIQKRWKYSFGRVLLNICAYRWEEEEKKLFYSIFCFSIKENGYKKGKNVSIQHTYKKYQNTHLRECIILVRIGEK